MTKSNYEDYFNPEDIKNDKEIPYIEWATIDNNLTAEDFQLFDEWIRGQSSFIEGAFADDVQNFFYNKNRWTLNKLPHWY